AAGFLPQQLTDEHRSALLSDASPLLVVVDYAETRQDILGFLEALAQGSTASRRVRVALLAREASDWWRALNERSEQIRHLLDAHATLEPEPVPSDGRPRADIYQTAARSFAKALGRAVPTSSRMDLRAEVFSRILYLHMAALSDVLGLGLSVENLLQGTIE